MNEATLEQVPATWKDFPATCLNEKAVPLCPLGENEVIAPTRYPVVLIPGSGGLNYYFYQLSHALGAKCEKCRGRVEPEAAALFDAQFLQYCDFNRDEPSEYLDDGDPYAFCCGNDDEQAIYIPKLQGFQTSSTRTQCLDVHLRRARDLFDHTNGQSNDADQDGIADYVSLIGYSMGGVDAALMAAGWPHGISLNNPNKIVSVTTLASPLHGSRVATAMLELLQLKVLKPVGKTAIDDIRESQLHNAIALYFANRQSPGFQKNKATAVISWLEQMQSEKVEVAAPEYWHPQIYYQSFATYAFVSPQAYQELSGRFWLRKSNCAQLNPMDASSQGILNQRVLWHTRAALQDADIACKETYAMNFPAGKTLSTLSLNSKSQWWDRLPWMLPEDAALWIYAMRTAGTDGNQWVEAGDGLVPTKSAVMGIPVSFKMGNISALVDTVKPGRWWFRGALPTDHDGVVGGQDSRTSTVWAKVGGKSSTFPNPCTGFDSVCFFKTLFKELNALGY